MSEDEWSGLSVHTVLSYISVDFLESEGREREREREWLKDRKTDITIVRELGYCT